MVLSVKQRILGMQDNLTEEFDTHAVQVSFFYQDEPRLLKVFVNYPLSDKDLTLDVMIPKVKVKKFFDYMERDLMVNIYKFIELAAKRYGYDND